MRLSAWTWPFSFGVRLGWATARLRNPDPFSAPAWVFLLRGNGVIFSRGFGALCNRFRAHGLWAEDLRCVGERWLYRRLTRLHGIGKLCVPVILIGHSCGGRYALTAAQWLEPAGIRIDLLICLDVAMAALVPGNVLTAAHLYRSRRRLYPARPLQAAEGSCTHILNVDLDGCESPINPYGMHHLNITACRAVQEWVANQVLARVTDRPALTH